MPRPLQYAFAAFVLATSPSQAEPIPDAGISAASAWFDDQGIREDGLANMPVAEVGKRLNQAVYSFCQHGSQPGDINELFVRCTAACGGYSYVLRGLLEALGHETRYANFYNIPNQGNHTAVEVRLEDGSWGFLDPTFGAFFTVDGKAEGQLLPITSIAYELPFGSLGQHVLQSAKVGADILGSPLAQLYPLKFDHQYMVLENYQVAEQISTGETGTELTLEVPLDVVDGRAEIGTPDLASLQEMQAKWLEDTNATLNDEDPLNDTSFNTSMLYADADVDRETVITVDGLEPGHRYQLKLTFRANPNVTGRMQINGVGKAVRIAPAEGVTVSSDGVVYEAKFTPLRRFAQFRVRNMEETGVVHLLGVHIEAAKRSFRQASAP